MATLYISEFAELQLGGNGQALQAAKQPGVTTQTVSIAAGSAQSAAFNDKTRYVRLHTDAICSVAFGSNPTATAANARLAADATEYFAVNPADKVAVITNT